MARDHDPERVCVRRADVAYLLRTVREARHESPVERHEMLVEAVVRLLRPLEDAELDVETERLLHAFLRSFEERSERRSGVDLTITRALSRRARETLDWLLTGASEKEIAVALGISVHTVHHYVKAIYRQLGVSSRVELIASRGSRREKRK